MNNIGEIIKEYRTKKNISRKELSELSGVGTTTIADIETGRAKNPGIETIEKISNILKIPINIIFKETNKINEYREKNNIFFSKYEKLSNENKEKINKIIEIFEEETQE